MFILSFNNLLNGFNLTINFNFETVYFRNGNYCIIDQSVLLHPMYFIRQAPRWLSKMENKSAILAFENSQTSAGLHMKILKANRNQLPLTQENFALQPIQLINFLHCELPRKLVLRIWNKILLPVLKLKYIDDLKFLFAHRSVFEKVDFWLSYR